MTCAERLCAKKAFIVRPFGTKAGINFDDIQEYLITPALAGVDVQGSITELFLQASNIRADMFQQVLVADIVIADVSIHNANVSYELGIRHALQPKRTILLRARNTKTRNERTAEDEVPFDLRTDWYIEYDSEKPADRLVLLIEALRQTIANDKTDSPVFQMLPDLEAQDRSRFLPVQQTFSVHPEALRVHLTQLRQFDRWARAKGAEDCVFWDSSVNCGAKVGLAICK